MRAMLSMRISVVVPVLNDAAALAGLLGDLAGSGLEIVVADGGSRDGSPALAARQGARVVSCKPGRGRQLDEGARAAGGDWLWFLHADSRVSAAALAEIAGLPGQPPGWGRFDVQLDGSGPNSAIRMHGADAGRAGQATAPGAMFGKAGNGCGRLAKMLLRMVAALMNRRSALTGICTGDQGIFVHRALLDAVAGMPRQPLMEDIELSRRLRRLARPQRLRGPLRASARRWLSRGPVRTILSMWAFRLRYWLGASPERLAREYYGGRRASPPA